MPIARRRGSPGHGQIECRQSPPAPGFHLARSGTSHNDLHQRPALAAVAAVEQRGRRHAAPQLAVADAGLDHPDALDGRAGAGRERRPLGLLPLAGGIVGVEQVRAELAVRDAGEIAAAARDRGWRTRPPRRESCAPRSPWRRRAGHAGRRGLSCVPTSNSVMCFILLKLRRRCAARRPARSAHRAKRLRRRETASHGAAARPARRPPSPAARDRTPPAPRSPALAVPPATSMVPSPPTCWQIEPVRITLRHVRARPSRRTPAGARRCRSCPSASSPA